MAARNMEKAGARVAQEIVQTIYDERLRPGDHYLSEGDALQRHGVSRATFREAIRFLEFQGVVSVRAGPGGGIIVERPDWPNLTSTFALLLQFDEASLADVMAARTALEPVMAGLAARNATERQLDAIGSLLALAEATVQDHDAFTEAYRAFWATVAQATGNAVTAMLWPALRALVDTGGFVPEVRYRQKIVKSMRQLFTALQAHDPQAAMNLLAQLDQEFSERLSSKYPERIARTIAWSDV